MELLPDEFTEDISPLPEQAGLPREHLSSLIEKLDRRFDEVGSSLGEAAKAFGAIIGALQDVVGAFENSGMAQARDDITAAAAVMYNVADQIEQRESETALLPAASKRLRDLSSDVLRSLKMLRIYGVNIKIAASGAPDFIAFVDNIAVKLSNGEATTSGFGELLTTLEESLETLAQSDRSLALECRLVVPQVPEGLIADLESLSKYQDQLAQLAHATSDIARAVQQEVGGAICAIQVGDRARQRLEHVLTGIAVLEAVAVTDPEPADQMRGHAITLLRALTDATRVEFDRDLHSLITAMHNLQPPSEQLTNFLSSRAHNPGEEDDGIFLRRLEQGIGQAASMTENLDRADLHAKTTMDLIAEIVADIADRARAIGTLRVEVQDMAVNVSLQARQAGSCGPPIKVVANEIRDRSDDLNKLVDAIGLVERDLLGVAQRMKEMVEQQSSGVAGMLARSLASIRESAEQTETSMKLATRIVATVMPILQDTTDILESCEAMSGEMIEVMSDLSGGEPWNSDVSVLPSHPLNLFMQTMAKSYTMADERTIHNRFLLPDMAPIGGVPKVDVSEDDDLFDDFDDFGTDTAGPEASTETDDGTADDDDLDDVFF